MPSWPEEPWYNCCGGRRTLPASPGGGLEGPLPHVFVAPEEPRQPAKPEAESETEIWYKRGAPRTPCHGPAGARPLQRACGAVCP